MIYECPKCGKQKELFIKHKYKCRECKIDMELFIKPELKTDEPKARFISKKIEKKDKNEIWRPMLNGKPLNYKSDDVDDDFIILQGIRYKKSNKLNKSNQINDWLSTSVKFGYRIC